MKCMKCVLQHRHWIWCIKQHRSGLKFHSTDWSWECSFIFAINLWAQFLLPITQVPTGNVLVHLRTELSPVCSMSKCHKQCLVLPPLSLSLYPGCEKEVESSMWIYVLLGNLLRGIGETPIQPLGITYIDDYASEDSAAFYIGKIINQITWY